MVFNEIPSLATKLRLHVLEPIKQRLVAKDEIIEVLGIALIASENAFLLGPPGTGKSAIVHELASRLQGKAFDYLLTRFTEPSELFGPFDLRRLREGELITNTEGMLPEADFVFLDELLNANSAVLNSLLAALNERVFRRGREKTLLPMLITIGASNRLPEDDALQALFDRFLLRVHCDNVDSEQLGDVLDAGRAREHKVPATSSLSVNAIRQLQAAILEINLTPIRTALIEVIKQLRQAGMAISDRRAVRLQRVIAASAVLSGRTTAIVSDLWPIRMIWDTPAQIEMLHSHVQSVIDKFAPKNDAHDLHEHPLANPDRGPDPEMLRRSIENVANSQSPNQISDSLSLLAARVEWVQHESAREHLRQIIQDIRRKFQPS